MAVGTPRVEREQGAKHTETDEYEREEHVLYVGRYVVVSGNLHHVHGGSTVEEVYSEDTENEQGRTSHEHQRKLHGGILLVAAAPYADEKVHRDEGYLVEHEHGEHVYADEEAEHTG